MARDEPRGDGSWQTLKVFHPYAEKSRLYFWAWGGVGTAEVIEMTFHFGLERSSADWERVDCNGERQEDFQFQWSLWKVTCDCGIGEKSAQESLGRICWPAGHQWWYMEKSQGVTNNLGSDIICQNWGVSFL